MDDVKIYLKASDAKRFKVVKPIEITIWNLLVYALQYCLLMGLLMMVMFFGFFVL
jgi:hypothetical protein